ncbi:oxidoreductase, 2OG-Fe(II) oxygenase family protein [Teladorsagia circumcincta]|uniref:Oxidoreductase, 2OG-Fe(II) oxygenase family protein n=1 Tax=Teladorsagia circumcincta TaxID=45464 RepID=A0A2G9UYD9_TELCI|nr:oxidoreductase, 2OG-Fe(II) oxygenase family protein [Teladorsagia circumcincta]
MFSRVKAMLPSVNFGISEPWEVLSYKPEGHYALHYDYLNYSSPEEWDSWRRDYGDRFATFLLMLQPATKGGGTVFPSVGATVMPSSGDALFWTNMKASEEIKVMAVFSKKPPPTETCKNPTVIEIFRNGVFREYLVIKIIQDLDSLHGGCAVWEGEKIAAVLWIRANGQDLLRSTDQNGRMDIKKLIRPRVEYFGMTTADN